MTPFTEKYNITTLGQTDVKKIRRINPEPNETYWSNVLVGSINWLVMALRYDLSYTAKELSRVLTEPNTTAANTILE
jgi:hypothetical protein